MGRLAAGNLRWCTVPDLVAIVFKSQGVAEEVARVAGLKADRRTLQLEPADMDRLVAERGNTWSLADANEIECITPWGAFAPRPEFHEQAALFRVGWVEFRRDAVDRAQDLSRSAETKPAQRSQRRELAPIGDRWQGSYRLRERRLVSGFVTCPLRLPV